MGGRPSRGSVTTVPENRKGNVRPSFLNRAAADKLGRMKRLVDVMLGLTAAAATALLLGLIAHDDMGMPIDVIRVDALRAAGFIFVAISFGTLLGRQKN
jgi:hypothetical protein